MLKQIILDGSLKKYIEATTAFSNEVSRVVRLTDGKVMRMLVPYTKFKVRGKLAKVGNTFKELEPTLVKRSKSEKTVIRKATEASFRACTGIILNERKRKLAREVRDHMRVTTQALTRVGIAKRPTATIAMISLSVPPQQ